MATHPICLPSDIPCLLTLIDLPADSRRLQLGPNDGGIDRGDRQETGDDEARPTETGSGPARPTADPTSLGGTTSIRQPPVTGFDADEELRDNYGMEVVEPTDGRLGLTDIGDVPADDWAADTGPTKSPESEP
jgi:hypothetical protein